MVLVDFGMITPDKAQSVIEKNKLRREKAKLRNESKKNKKLFFEKVESIGFDGRQDATLAVDKINEKHFTSTILEEHYVVTVEPNDYLDHFTPESERGMDIAHGLWQEIHGTKLKINWFKLNVMEQTLILDTREVQSHA